MAQASRRQRYQRRLKRQRNQATRAAESFMDTAYKSRIMAMTMEIELQKRDKALAKTEEIIQDYVVSKGLAPEDGDDLFNQIKALFDASPEKTPQPTAEPVYGDVANQLEGAPSE